MGGVEGVGGGLADDLSGGEAHDVHLSVLPLPLPLDTLPGDTGQDSSSSLLDSCDFLVLHDHPNSFLTFPAHSYLSGSFIFLPSSSSFSTLFLLL